MLLIGNYFDITFLLFTTFTKGFDMNVVKADHGYNPSPNEGVEPREFNEPDYIAEFNEPAVHEDDLHSLRGSDDDRRNAYVDFDEDVNQLRYPLCFPLFAATWGCNINTKQDNNLAVSASPRIFGLSASTPNILLSWLDIE
ncbi:hypothetical protein J5N97_016527 [Dioscorea zingiberensis]|uniref:Uncharacterized protein n=1 Tax=Dioscorea zingiberensis TaxID=325984 RepID=A0A9D5CLA9_9LILI|nr:hypothetical protein J5N97_016527 [Dioscorea zingiberensis]